MNVYYLILYLTPLLILYSYRSVHIVTDGLPTRLKWIVRIVYLVFTVVIYASTSFFAINRDKYMDSDSIRDYTVIGAITLSVTILSISIFQLLGDLILLGRELTFRASSSSQEGEKISRWTFMSKIALGVGGIMLGSFLWGTTKGIYGWRILENKLSFDNLPKAFHGTRIVQISDLHLGSFRNNYEPLREAVQMINELNPDYIFFTGDLVNTYATEAEGEWIEVFKGLKAKRGKYSILGNHDYGHYGDLTPEEEAAVKPGVIEINKKMGFSVMLNEHEIIEKDGEKIGLIGVENWGDSDYFPKEGDIKKAMEGMEEVPFKVLLSHDPTHWEEHIRGKENIDLTLSGHTHGGQMGITIPGILEISAGKLLYKRYAGLYTEAKQHLYINRGMGFLIFPGRVGMPPEITLHELNKA